MGPKIQKKYSTLNMSVIFELKCLCGQQLFKLVSDCQAIYGHQGIVACDLCKKTVPRNEFVYHCRRNKNAIQHPNGFDICQQCVGSDTCHQSIAALKSKGLTSNHQNVSIHQQRKNSMEIKLWQNTSPPMDQQHVLHISAMNSFKEQNKEISLFPAPDHIPMNDAVINEYGAHHQTTFVQQRFSPFHDFKLTINRSPDPFIEEYVNRSPLNPLSDDPFESKFEFNSFYI